MKTLKDYPDVLTVDDLADFLKIGKNATYKLLQNNEILHHRIGRNYRIPKSSVEKFLNISELPSKPLTHFSNTDERIV